MGFIMLIGLIAFIVFTILLIIGAIKKDTSKRKRNWIGFIVAFILFAVGVSNLPSSTPTSNKTSSTKQQSTSTVKKAAKQSALQSLITDNFKKGKLIENGEDLTIQYQPDTVSENNFITVTLNSTALGLNKVYKNDEFKKFKVIHIKSMAPFTDKYGNSTTDLGMELTFDQSEIQKVKDFESITPEQLILLEGSYRTGLNANIKSKISPENYKILYPNQ